LRLAAARPCRPAPAPLLPGRGRVGVAVFGGLRAVTAFSPPEDLRRLRALRRGTPAPAPTLRAPDSTEMAGEIVATDIEAPEQAAEEQGSGSHKWTRMNTE